jgi:NADH:ubiquinone oxidoreductase subunit 5 (subunit L)/multisubunit Na+/H+ antiporter MnhA subunit
MSIPVTTFYSMRLLVMAFGGKVPNNFYYNSIKIHEGNNFLIIPLIILIFGSLNTGYFFKDVFCSHGLEFWQSAIQIQHPPMIDLEYLGNVKINSQY